MRILLLSATFPSDPGGVATHVSDLAHGLVRRGHEVSVVTRSKDGKLRRRGRGKLKIWKIGRNKVQEYDGRRVFGQTVIEFAQANWYQIEPEIIHAHDLDSLFVGWTLKAAYQRRLVATIHRAPSPWRANRFQEDPKDCFLEALRLTGSIDALIVPSKASAEVLREQGFGTGEGERPVSVIPHGVGPYLRSVADDPQILDELCPNREAKLVVCPSRADEHKDVLTFVEAAGILGKGVGAPECLKFLLCCDEDDPFYKAATRRAAELGLREGQEIFFRKLHYKAMATAYRRAAACVIPSRHESFGLAVLEAFLLDVPVIAANTTALREIVENGTNGLLFTDGDPSDLARQLSRVLSDARLRGTLTENGRRTVQEGATHSVTRMVEAHERVYMQLTS